MIQSKTVTYKILSLLFLYACSYSAAETIRVVGSDYVGAALGVEGSAVRKIANHDVNYRMTGSRIGLLKLKEGFADVAFVLQRSEEKTQAENFKTIPLGYWGLYFAVQEENPLSEVKEADLDEILRKTRDGLKSEWGSLLANEPKWANRLIFVSINVLDSDPSYPVLLNRFFNNEVPEKFYSIGERIEDPYSASNSNLLVMSQLPEPGRGLRALALVALEQEVGYTPSPESMHFGDYPLRSSLHLVVRDPEDPKVKAFLEDFFASDGPQLLKNSGLVSVPENVQKQALLEFDLEF